MTSFIQINLSELVTAIGEDETKKILSCFECPNKDVQNFLREKAIVFSERKFAKTHLVFWVSGDNKETELVGYYTVTSKFIYVSKDSVSKNQAKKLREHGDFNENTGEFTVAAPLIGQLGKNFATGNNYLISGAELLQMAMDKVKKVQNEIGGRFVYLECEDNPKLLAFYTQNNFKIFGKRKLERDETDITGEYLIQLFAML